MTGKATTSPAKAPTTVEVLAEDEIKHAEGSQPAKDAYANPARLPIAVNIIVVFMFKYT